MGAGVVVDNGLICDIGGLSGVCQGREVLFQKVVIRTDAGYHQAVAVSPDGLFENGSQFGVAVWHIDFLFSFTSRCFSQDTDDLPQCKKRLVDVNTFLGLLPFSTSLANSLGPS